MTGSQSPSGAHRASRGNQLASAFLLAYIRGDEHALLLILEDVGDDVMPFAIGLASHAKTIAEMRSALPLLERYLRGTVTVSADLAADPDAQGRIDRGEI